MRVLVPLNNREHIDDYIEAGAGEFYIGFYDEEWSKKFGEYADINRMSGFKQRANPFNVEQVVEIIQEVKKKGYMIYVTFNSSCYSQEQLNYMKKYFIVLKETQVDGVIVSCYELAVLAHKMGLAVVISTIGGVYNSLIAKFYKEMGAKRIIIPRDLSVDEIEMMVKEQPDMEYEVFMMRNGCMFSDSNCLGFHRNETCSICGSLISVDNQIRLKENTFSKRHQAELNDLIYTKSFHSYACGLCSLYRFIRMNITACKIVGRSDEWENICKDIKNVRDNILIANQCNSQEEFLERMILPEESRNMCKLGLSCYYPEMRF